MKWLRERLRSIQSRIPSACVSDPTVEFSEDGSQIRIVDGDQEFTISVLRHAKLIGGQLLDVAREIERRDDRKYEDVE